MTPRKLAINIVGSFMAGAFVLWLLASCVSDKPPTTDAGADPDISACCDWYLVPLYYDKPQACLDEHTDDGECRWLTCLGGLVTYHTTGCR